VVYISTSTHIHPYSVQLMGSILWCASGLLYIYAHEGPIEMPYIGTLLGYHISVPYRPIWPPQSTHMWLFAGQRNVLYVFLFRYAVMLQACRTSTGTWCVRFWQWTYLAWQSSMSWLWTQRWFLSTSRLGSPFVWSLTGCRNILFLNSDLAR